MIREESSSRWNIEKFSFRFLCSIQSRQYFDYDKLKEYWREMVQKPRKTGEGRSDYRRICNTMIYWTFSSSRLIASSDGKQEKVSTKKSFFIISLSSTIPINFFPSSFVFHFLTKFEGFLSPQKLRGKLNNRWLCEKVCFCSEDTNWHFSVCCFCQVFVSFQCCFEAKICSEAVAIDIIFNTLKLANHLVKV